MGQKIINLSKRVSSSVSSSVNDPKKRKKWQMIAGISVIIVFASLSVFFHSNYKTAQALQNSGYGYGYGQSIYDYGYGYSTHVPSAVSNLACTASTSTSITCQFSAVTTSLDSLSLDNHDVYEIYYSTSDSTPDTGDSAGGTESTQGSSGTTVSIKTSSLSTATTYYFAVYTKDDAVNYSAISNVVTIATSGTTNDSPGVAPGAGPSGDDADADADDDADADADDDADADADDDAVLPTEALTLEQLDAEAAVATPVLPEADRDTAAEASALTEMTELLDGQPSTDAEWNMVYYISYGSTPSSQTYSSRDRRDVMYDFVQIFGTAPVNNAEWADVNLIINGHKPDKRVIAREVVGIDHFKKVYLRDPDWSNEHDTWAVLYMSYAIRYRPRDLAKERVGIDTFRRIYGYTPANATDWSVVRAIAYSGAAR